MNVAGALTAGVIVAGAVLVLERVIPPLPGRHRQRAAVRPLEVDDARLGGAQRVPVPARVGVLTMAVAVPGVLKLALAPTRGAALTVPEALAVIELGAQLRALLHRPATRPIVAFGGIRGDILRRGAAR